MKNLDASTVHGYDDMTSILMFKLFGEPILESL